MLFLWLVQKPEVVDGAVCPVKSRPTRVKNLDHSSVAADDQDICIGRRTKSEVEKHILTRQRSIRSLEVRLLLGGLYHKAIWYLLKRSLVRIHAATVVSLFLPLSLFFISLFVEIFFFSFSFFLQVASLFYFVLFYFLLFLPSFVFISGSSIFPSFVGLFNAPPLFVFILVFFRGILWYYGYVVSIYHFFMYLDQQKIMSILPFLSANFTLYEMGKKGKKHNGICFFLFN